MVKPTWGQYLKSVQKNDSVRNSIYLIFCFDFVFLRELFAGRGRSKRGTQPQDTRLASDCPGSDRLDEETKLKSWQG
jgi:hypothetical protein